MAHNHNIDLLYDGNLTTMVISFLSGIVLQLNESMFLNWDFPPLNANVKKFFAF